jgi:hypothetical protein
MHARPMEGADLAPVVELAARPRGAERGEPFIRPHLDRHHLMVAGAGGEVVGGYRELRFQERLPPDGGGGIDAEWPRGTHFGFQERLPPDGGGGRTRR